MSPIHGRHNALFGVDACQVIRSRQRCASRTAAGSGATDRRRIATIGRLWRVAWQVIGSCLVLVLLSALAKRQFGRLDRAIWLAARPVPRFCRLRWRWRKLLRRHAQRQMGRSWATIGRPVSPGCFVSERRWRGWRQPDAQRRRRCGRRERGAIWTRTAMATTRKAGR